MYTAWFSETVFLSSYRGTVELYNQLLDNFCLIFLIIGIKYPFNYISSKFPSSQFLCPDNLEIKVNL